MTKLDTLTDLETILRKVGFIPKHQRALDFLNLLKEDADTLHYEPAVAAAAVLAFYWEGMSYPDDGLDSLKMFMDVQTVSDMLYAWTHKVVKKLKEEHHG